MSPVLDDLLAWVQEIVVHPEGPEAGVCSKEARSHMDVSLQQVGDVLMPSSTLTPIERIGIYARMYPLRMSEALATDYPVVKSFLGEDRWYSLVAGYVQSHPSRHQNLNQLGRHLPEYIRSQRGLPERGFLAELADLELAMTLVFDAEESLPLEAAELVTLPPERWAHVRLRPVDAFQLRAYSYPVNEHLQAVKEDRQPPPIRKSASHVLVYRKRYVIWRATLDRERYRLLKQLAEGKTVGEALAKSCRSSDAAALAAWLRLWFRDWVEEGLFTRLEVP